jgi:hypothetical protein
MAGKYLSEFDERARQDEEAETRAKAALEVWTEQLRQAKADLLRALAISPDAPHPGLAGVGVYTEMHCPKCNRLIYWKVRVIREFFCVGCDEWPTVCLCPWKEPVHAG